MEGKTLDAADIVRSRFLIDLDLRLLGIEADHAGGVNVCDIEVATAQH